MPPSIVGIIPARLQSSRLPRKMLLRESGKPLIQYAWEAASRAKSLSQVLIATDSEEIADVARGFGARVAMTGDHPSGGDRIAEVVRRECTDASLIVNVQGDEPELPPEVIDGLVSAMQSRPEIEMGTLATPINSMAVLQDTSCVKVVCTADGRALYFSRLPIPYYRDGQPEDLLHPGEETAAYQQSPWKLHLGIYAYRPEFLLAITSMPRSRLEQLESLEQLRALEAGATILVKTVSHRSVGIDTAADYAAFLERQKRLG
ncbi:3-deoxy-manno-octulosonate cytidylyltransferase [Planctomicrobium piriforme]|uniref:3-deoxy-manno-octulosonate cytidylyltransferase n=1 Tax=Planctomicrobium piriforme TaxID=1576369 RepID=A0A1I3AY63_9PLAN|nr:3-deoxy-manno-octulosonate cytidylyltransferase [Planctomicrobium piriforme]SFH54880.1 3-deoxy-manno-octulosonate cytidylyltransferase (CMP-KDO synthetase) [Planctomicrobium piriforme]